MQESLPLPFWPETTRHPHHVGGLVVPHPSEGLARVLAAGQGHTGQLVEAHPFEVHLFGLFLLLLLLNHLHTAAQVHVRQRRRVDLRCDQAGSCREIAWSENGDVSEVLQDDFHHLPNQKSCHSDHVSKRFLRLCHCLVQSHPFRQTDPQRHVFLS